MAPIYRNLAFRMPDSHDPPGDSFERPVPRGPKSPTRTVQIQAQNRRREYLARNPTYFDSLELELADPVLYGRLVRRHHSAAEREAEGKAKGYGRTLEAALQRGESKLAHLHQENGNGEAKPNGKEPESGLDHPWDQPVENKEQGQEQWRAFLEHRFVHGRDDEFDYTAIDNNDDLDVMSRKDAEDAWFDDEEPSWVEDGQTPDAAMEERRLEGETGVQDF